MASNRKVEKLEDLDPMILDEVRDGLEFGRGNRLGKLAARHFWTQELSTKERIECAKIRFGYVKEVMAYTKAKLKATEAGMTSSEADDAIAGMTEDEMAEYLGKKGAAVVVEARDES